MASQCEASNFEEPGAIIPHAGICERGVGQPERFDCEYERNGVGTLFMMVAPLEGWRAVRTTEQKKRVDYARCLQWLSDVRFVHADKIVLVNDNLNTHHAASLYQAFAPDEARRLMERFEFH